MKVSSKVENKVYSQNGEDGVIQHIFGIIGTDSKTSVEFGAGDGTECNTRLLRDNGWFAKQFDGELNNDPMINEAYFTAENINDIFNANQVPHNLDLLSIDVDSNDLWLWDALSEDYKPRLVVIEYNAKIPPEDARTVVYDPELVWDGSDYMGASLKALNYVAKRKGYSLVYCEDMGVNAFFVRDDLMNTLKALTVDEAYKPPKYGIEVDGVYIGHAKSDKNMVYIDENLKLV